MNRLTLQGALRYDRPWSWFPETVEPAGRFFPGATFARTDGVTGYNDFTPRMGATYDLFGNGKTALKVNLGKYLQGASVSNLAYNANPALRIPFGTGLSTTGLCLFGALGFANPCVARSWTDLDGDFTPDCNLQNPLAQSPATGAGDVCGQIDNLQFGSNQLVGAQFDPDLLQRIGPASIRLVVRRCRCSRSSSRVHRWRSVTTAGRSRVHHRRLGDRQPLDQAERCGLLHADRSA